MSCTALAGFIIFVQSKLTFQIAGILEVEKTYDICGKKKTQNNKYIKCIIKQICNQKVFFNIIRIANIQL